MIRFSGKIITYHRDARKQNPAKKGFPEKYSLPEKWAAAKKLCTFFKLDVDKLRRIGYNNKAFCESAK